MWPGPMKPFLTNKVNNSDVILRGGNEMITDEKRLAKLLMRIILTF